MKIATAWWAGLRIAVVAMLVASASVVAVAENTIKPVPVVWYTDATFQALDVMRPLMNQSDWLNVLKNRWDKYDVFIMNDGTSVNSCREAFRLTANHKDSYPKNTPEDIYVAHVVACYAAQAIYQAIPARVSHLSNFKMDAADARTLPAALTLVISNYQAEKITRATKLGKTLGDVLPKGATFSVRHNPRGDAPMVRVNDGSGGIEDMSLLARGDFNHDGIEDLLIAVSSSVVGGTYRQSDLYLITRLGPHAPMKVLAAYPDLNLGIPTFH